MTRWLHSCNVCHLFYNIIKRKHFHLPSAILSHEPKIAKATLVSSPPRSPPSEGLHLATTTPKWHVALDRMFAMFSIYRCCSCLLTGGFCDRLSVLPYLAERHYPITFARVFFSRRGVFGGNSSCVAHVF